MLTAFGLVARAMEILGGVPLPRIEMTDRLVEDWGFSEDEIIRLCDHLKIEDNFDEDPTVSEIATELAKIM